MRANQTKTQVLEQKYIAGPCKEWVACAEKSVLQLKIPSKAFFKGQVRDDAGCVISSRHCSLIGCWAVSVLGARVLRLLSTYQAVNFFHLVVVLASINQLRKCYQGSEELQQRIWGGSIQTGPINSYSGVTSGRDL